MRRTQIQLDEDLFQALRRRAFDQGCSLSALVRDLLSRALQTRRREVPLEPKHFAFVAAGRSKQGRLSPVSERHDEALSEALREEHDR